MKKLGLSHEEKKDVYELLTQIDELLVKILQIYLPFCDGENEVAELTEDYESEKQKFEEKVAPDGKLLKRFKKEVASDIPEEQAALNELLEEIREAQQKHQRQMDRMFEKVYEQMECIKKLPLQPIDLLPAGMSYDSCEDALCEWLDKADYLSDFRDTVIPVAERVIIAYFISLTVEHNPKDLRDIIEKQWRDD